MPADLTTALGALLADRSLRETLRRDPSAAARTLKIDPSALAEIDLGALDRQAESLIDKRYHEVQKRLPQTLNQLTLRGAELFKQYAPGLWPEGHRRHVRDATAFGKFLLDRGLPVCRSEWNRARFAAGFLNLALYYAPDHLIAGRRRKALELFLRFRGTVCCWAIGLGL
jgi:hypothetical protein